MFGIVLAEVSAAALLALDGAARDRLGDRQQVVQVQRRVPAGVVFAVAADADTCRPVAAAAPSPSSARCISSSFRTMPTRLLHHLLQRVLHLVRPFARRVALERLERPAARPSSTCAGVDGAAALVLRVLRGMLAGALAEHEQVGQRVAAEPVGAVDAGGALARGEQAGHAWTSACRRPRGCRP